MFSIAESESLTQSQSQIHFLGQSQSPDRSESQIHSQSQSQPWETLQDDNSWKSKLDSIWEDDMIDKHWSNEGKPAWKCGWCGSTFPIHNGTKALAHVSLTKGKDIKPCVKGFMIDKKHMSRYLELMNRNKSKQISRKNARGAIDNANEEHGNMVAKEFEDRRKKNKIHGKAFVSPVATVTTIQDDNDPHMFGLLDNLDMSVLQGGGTQLLLTESPCQDAKLTVAIADLIHSHALPFSLASTEKFQMMIKLARMASLKYKPPGRNEIGGKLLDLNYKIYLRESMKKLLIDSDVYGVSLFGDGATIRKCPMVNILASCVHLPACCLEILDCQDHMGQGGKKDAGYIASCFEPYMEMLLYKGNNVVDLILFDGAANMQKAGRVLATKYKRLTVLHGAEHVMSLFFNDIFKIPEIRIFMKICKIIYKHFGSGSMHGPYSIFMKYAKMHNGNKRIGLIRAADTRMGGHCIALLRMLRLKKALINTVNAADYQHHKVFVLYVNFVAVYLKKKLTLLLHSFHDLNGNW
jgi:hypothetical protein